MEQGKQILAAQSCRNGGSHSPGARDKPQLHLVGEEMKCRKKKAGCLRSSCPNKDQDKPSLLIEVLLISIANYLPEPGAGETPCTGARFANEGKSPQDHFYLWVFFSGHFPLGTQQPQLMKPVYINVAFSMSLKGDANPWEVSWCWGRGTGRFCD